MRATVVQLTRFGLVGIAATLVHIGVAWLVHATGASPLLANAAGFLAAFALSYLGHFYWTFSQREGHPKRLPRFVVVAGVGFALSNAIVWGAVVLVGAPFELALAVILVSVPTATWLLSRLWAFR